MLGVNLMVRDTRNRFHNLKSLPIASIVTKTTVAVTSSCELVTTANAVASANKSLIGDKTSEFNSQYMGLAKSLSRIPRHHNCSIMLPLY
jgi:hypothetical protein